MGECACMYNYSGVYGHIYMGLHNYICIYDWMPVLIYRSVSFVHMCAIVRKRENMSTVMKTRKNAHICTHTV